MAQLSEKFNQAIARIKELRTEEDQVVKTSQEIITDITNQFNHYLHGMASTAVGKKFELNNRTLTIGRPNNIHEKVLYFEFETPRLIWHFDRTMEYYQNEYDITFSPEFVGRVSARYAELLKQVPKNYYQSRLHMKSHEVLYRLDVPKVDDYFNEIQYLPAMLTLQDGTCYDQFLIEKTGPNTAEVSVFYENKGKYLGKKYRKGYEQFFTETFYKSQSAIDRLGLWK